MDNNAVKEVLDKLMLHMDIATEEANEESELGNSNGVFFFEGMIYAFEIAMKEIEKHCEDVV